MDNNWSDSNGKKKDPQHQERIKNGSKRNINNEGAEEERWSMNGAGKSEKNSKSIYVTDRIEKSSIGRKTRVSEQKMKRKNPKYPGNRSYINKQGLASGSSLDRLNSTPQGAATAVIIQSGDTRSDCQENHPCGNPGSSIATQVERLAVLRFIKQTLNPKNL